MSDLTFVPTSEILDELMQRQTFVGVIIYSPEEHKGGKSNFPMKLYSTPCRESTIDILKKALEELEEMAE